MSSKDEILFKEEKSMNSKKNFKRVAAGALAVLTVVGTMPTNVGDIWADNISALLVADAAESQKLDFGSADTYLTYAKVGNNEYQKKDLDNISSFRNIAVGTAIVIISKVPLDFSEKAGINVKGEGDSITNPLTETLNEDGTYTYSFNMPEDADGEGSKTLELVAQLVKSTLAHVKKKDAESDELEVTNDQDEMVSEVDVKYANGDDVDGDANTGFSFILDSTVRVSGKDAFVLRVDDNNSEGNIVKPALKYDSETESFYSDFVVPQNASIDEQWAKFRDKNQISFRDINRNNTTIYNSNEVQEIVKSKWVDIIKAYDPATGDTLQDYLNKEIGELLDQDAVDKDGQAVLDSDETPLKWSDMVYKYNADPGVNRYVTVKEYIGTHADTVFTNTYKDSITLTVEKVSLDDAKYNVDGDKLLISSAKAGISNMQIAEITAIVGEMKVVTEGEDPVFEPDKVQDADGNYVTDANGKPIFVTVSNGETLPNGKVVKVTYKPTEGNGIFLKDVAAEAKYTYGSNETVGFVMDGVNNILKEVGSHKVTVTYTDPNNDNTSYTITKNFGIAAKTALNASDLELDIKHIINAKNAAGTVFTEKNDIFVDTKPIQGINGGVTKFVTKDDITSIQQFTVEPKFKEGINLNPNEYEFEGELSGSTMNREYEFTVKIYSAAYGGSKDNPKTFKVKWMVKSNMLDANFARPKVPFDTVVDGVTTEKSEYAVRVSLDNLDDLEDDIFEAALPNATAVKERAEYSYGYVEGQEAGANLDEDELDEYIEGLPSEAGIYKVYILRDGEKAATIAVYITAYSVNFVADEEDLTFTYGADLDEYFSEYSNYFLVDKEGNDVEGIEAKDITFRLYKAIQKDGYWVKDEGSKPVERNNDGNGFYDAGDYMIEFAANSSNDKYTIIGVPQELHINKKQITKDMILFSSIMYDGKFHDIVEETARGERGIFAFDKQTGEEIEVTAYEGGTRKEVGVYTAYVKIKNPAECKNYVGEVKDANWYIVPNEIKSNAGLKFDDEYLTLATDNDTEEVLLKGRITRNENKDIFSLEHDNEGEILEVAEFGVIYDNNERIAAPADYNNQNAKNEVDNANSYLVYGGAFKTGGRKTASVAQSKTDYMFNMPLRNGADVGWWVRPYIKYSDGTVSYGNSVYYKLGNEAVRLLNLKMNTTLEADGYTCKQEAVRRADNKNLAVGDDAIHSGYNPLTCNTYLYANFTDLEEINKKASSTLKVSNFGCVVDNKGIVTDKETAAKLLVVDYDYKKNGNPILTGQYKKGSTQLKVNEYAANVTHVDGVTGVWARPYLDLKGYVVYGEPVYFESDTEYFAAAKPSILEHSDTAFDNVANNLNNSYYTNVLTAKLRINRASGINENAITNKINDNKERFVAPIEVVKVGVVVDKYGKLNNDEGVFDEETAYKKLVLGNSDFVSGAKSSGLDGGAWTYTGSVTPRAKNVAARAYTVYRIKYTAVSNGVEVEKSTDVTIYGKIKTITQRAEGEN